MTAEEQAIAAARYCLSRNSAWQAVVKEERSAAERALLERLVPEVCSECARDTNDTPEQSMTTPFWFHGNYYCPASPLHELLKEMDDG